LRYWQGLHLYTVRRQCEVHLISMRDTRNWKKNEKNIADLNSLYTDSPSIESSDSDLKGVSGTQTTSWRNVNYAISQLRCEVWFTLGKQKIPAIPNSADVRVGDKLKVVQFHPVIRNNSTPSPKIINFGWHQLGVLWIRNTSISDVRCP